MPRTKGTKRGSKLEQPRAGDAARPPPSSSSSSSYGSTSSSEEKASRAAVEPDAEVARPARKRSRSREEPRGSAGGASCARGDAATAACAEYERALRRMHQERVAQGRESQRALATVVSALTATRAGILDAMAKRKPAAPRGVAREKPATPRGRSRER